MSTFFITGINAATTMFTYRFFHFSFFTFISMDGGYTVKRQERFQRTIFKAPSNSRFVLETDTLK